MTECLCESCRPDDPAPTYTEQFRHECEVRTIAGWRLIERNHFLEGVEKARGKDAADALRRDVAAHNKLAREIVDLKTNPERAARLAEIEVERGKPFAQGIRERAWSMMQGDVE